MGTREIFFYLSKFQLKMFTLDIYRHDPLVGRVYSKRSGEIL